MRQMLPLLLLLLATGCTTERGVSLGRTGGVVPSLVLTSPLMASNGAAIGEAILIEEASGDRLVLRARGLPEGQHPVSIHATSRCSGQGFAEAGVVKPGTLPPLAAEADGRADLFAELPAPRLRGTPDARLDDDGMALIVSVAGQPIACAAFRTR